MANAAAIPNLVFGEDKCQNEFQNCSFLIFAREHLDKFQYRSNYLYPTKTFRPMK